jgi:hypothetical protein
MARAAKLPSGAVQSRSWIGPGRLEPRLGPEALRPLPRTMEERPSGRRRPLRLPRVMPSSRLPPSATLRAETP